MGRPVKFTREKKQAFLDHFAGNCDLAASAAAAGVATCTVKRHLASDPAFAAGFEDALQVGYRLVEAEAVRQVQAAQEQYRIAPASDAGGISFDRALRLLRHYRRADGSVGRPPTPPHARVRWTFDEAMKALEKKLDLFEKNERRLLGPPAPEEA